MTYKTHADAEKYASDVVSGEIPASKAIIGACERYLSWIEEGKYVRNAYKTDEVIRFFQTLVRLQEEYEGSPFVPVGWQCWLLDCIFGFEHEDGSRVIRTVWLESAKGSGKGPMAAGITLYLMLTEAKAQHVYITARTYEQTKPVFLTIKNMITSEPRLGKKLQVLGGSNPYRIVAGKSYVATFSSEDKGKGKSGPIPSTVICDEVHELDNGDSVEILKKGFKSRESPLLLYLTNSGTTLESYAGIEHQHAINVASGKSVDDSYLPLVYSVDSVDDIKDEAMWIKSNPTLPATPGYNYIRSEVAASEHFPAKKAETERLTFGVWGKAKSYWVNPEILKERVLTDKLPDISKMPACLSLDLGKTQDFTALSLCAFGNDRFYSWTKTYIPSGNLADRIETDNVPYDQWIESGNIIPVPGNTMGYDFLAEEIHNVCTNYNVRMFCYDPWLFADVNDALNQLGVSGSTDFNQSVARYKLWYVVVPQTFRPAVSKPEGNPRTMAQRRRAQEKLDNPKMSIGTCIATTETMIVEDNLSILDNAPIWLAIQVVIADVNPDGWKKFNKGESKHRIDPLVSSVMAIGGAQVLKTRMRGKQSTGKIVLPSEALGMDEPMDDLDFSF